MEVYSHAVEVGKTVVTEGRSDGGELSEAPKEAIEKTVEVGNDVVAADVVENDAAPNAADGGQDATVVAKPVIVRGRKPKNVSVE